MKKLLSTFALMAAMAAPVLSDPVLAASAAQIDRNVAAALRDLYAGNRAAATLSQQAKGVLVFPSMVKAGCMFGGQLGEGALQKKGRSVGYYHSVAASYGFQAGVQKFGYA